MKKVRFYSCDGCCLLIGNSSARFNVPNGYGDGKHRVIVTDDQSEIETVEKRCGQRMRWIGRVEGDAINVYDYDCYSANELSQHVMFTLHGAFSVYSAFGTVILLKTEER